MCAATKLYDQNRFARDNRHALADVRHQFNGDRIEIRFLQWIVLNGIEFGVRYGIQIR